VAQFLQKNLRAQVVRIMDVSCAKIVCCQFRRIRGSETMDQRSWASFLGFKQVVFEHFARISGPLYQHAAPLIAAAFGNVSPASLAAAIDAARNFSMRHSIGQGRRTARTASLSAQACRQTCDGDSGRFDVMQLANCH